MKKMIIGLGFLLCGIIQLCSLKVITMLIEVNENTTLVSHGIEKGISCISIILGIGLLLYGYIKD